jgi:hypothetical protein
MARAASLKVSLKDRTSRTTVFTIPPRDICFKISHQLIRRREGIGRLSGLGVPVVALSALVVIAENASLLDDVRQAVLEQVRGGRDRHRQSPDHDFDESVGRHNDPATDQSPSLHVGENTNTLPVLSIYPTLYS